MENKRLEVMGLLLSPSYQKVGMSLAENRSDISEQDGMTMSDASVPQADLLSSTIFVQE